MSDIDDLRERVADACRVLGRLDLTKAATGHISARVPGTDRIVIRARGPGELGVRYTTENQVIEVDLDGKVVGGNDQGLDAPQEVFIHTALYKARADVNAVVHVHPPTVMLFTICDKPLLPIYGGYDPPSALMAIDGIPTYERSILISNPALGEELVRAMGDARLCLMRGHGITTSGDSVEAASLAAIQLNELASLNYQAHLLGNPRPISDEDQQAFRRMLGNEKKLSTDGQPNGRVRSLWRYYQELTRAD